MGQTRLFLTAQREQAEAIFSILDTRFEEDGLPISIFEPEEDSGIFQISVYTEDDVDQLEKQVLECLAGISPMPALERETVVESLSNLIEAPTDTIVLRAAPETRLQRLVDVAEALRAAGFTTIAIVE